MSAATEILVTLEGHLKGVEDARNFEKASQLFTLGYIVAKFMNGKVEYDPSDACKVFGDERLELIMSHSQETGLVTIVARIREAQS